MTAAPTSWRTPDHSSDASDLILLSLGGAVVGASAIAFCLVLDASLFGIALYFSSDGYGSTSWPGWAVVVTGIVAVAISLLIGRSLYGWKRWIGLKGDPADSELIARKRRHFTIGSMATYVVLTPFVWVVMVALANST
jgi:hypothetical protein